MRLPSLKLLHDSYFFEVKKFGVKSSAIALLFVLSTERRKGRVHRHRVRGGLQPGEACADGTPGARPARAHSSATMEERKQDCSEE